MYCMHYQTVVRQVILSALCVLTLAASQLVRADDVNAISNTAGIAVGPNDVTFIALAINTPAPRRLVIHYFAECQVDASGYIEYDIFVGNQQVPPTNDNFSALCSAPQAPATVGTVVYFPVPAGNHVIRVRGHVENGVGPGLIDDQSLIVEEEGP